MENGRGIDRTKQIEDVEWTRKNQTFFFLVFTHRAGAPETSAAATHQRNIKIQLVSRRPKKESEQENSIPSTAGLLIVASAAASGAATPLAGNVAHIWFLLDARGARALVEPRRRRPAYQSSRPPRRHRQESPATPLLHCRRRTFVGEHALELPENTREIQSNKIPPIEFGGNDDLAFQQSSTTPTTQ